MGKRGWRSARTGNEGPCRGPFARYHDPGTARLSSYPAEETEPDGGIVVGIFRKADGGRRPEFIQEMSVNLKEAYNETIK